MTNENTIKSFKVVQPDRSIMFWEGAKAALELVISTPEGEPLWVGQQPLLPYAEPLGMQMRLLAEAKSFGFH